MEITTPLIGSVSRGFDGVLPPINNNGTDKELKEASKDFVSVLFSYMFETMRGNPDDQDEESMTGSLFGGENMNMFLGFLDQEIAKKFSEQGGMDLVDTLYNQLKGNNVQKKDDKSSEEEATKDKLNSIT